MHRVFLRFSFLFLADLFHQRNSSLFRDALISFHFRILYRLCRWWHVYVVIVGEKLEHAILLVRRIISYLCEINRIYSFQIVRWENTDAILSTRNVRCEIYEKFEQILCFRESEFFFLLSFFFLLTYSVALHTTLSCIYDSAIISLRQVFCLYLPVYRLL